MRIGVPREIKANENRVGLVPACVRELGARGHEVLVVFPEVDLEDAYVWSNDVNRIARVTSALEYGMVAVNCVKMTGAPVPFGGMKQSGLGREGSRYGLEEFTELKYVCIAVAAAA